MQKRILFLLLLFFSLNLTAQDCNNENARRHSLIADGMREKMSSADDWQLVASEYEKAAQYAPDCPAIYYNLGICYEELGREHLELCDKAIAYYRKYLQLSPNAENKSEVEDLIYKIEGNKIMYQRQKVKELEKWVGKWYLHRIDRCGNEEYDQWPEGILFLKIFISQGNLIAEVGGFGRTIFTYDNKNDHNPKRTTKESDVIIPIVLEKDYISFEYIFIREFGHIYLKEGIDEVTTIKTKNNYLLHLVSPNRMEGQHRIVSKVPNYEDYCKEVSFYFEKK